MANGKASLLEEDLIRQSESIGITDNLSDVLGFLSDIINRGGSCMIVWSMKALHSNWGVSLKQ